MMEVEDCNSGNSSISLFDLPIESLTNIASYLRTSSRALFAVALAYDHKNAQVRDLCGIRSLHSWRKQLSAVGGERWDILDFGDLERDLARRLCDSDIEAVLLFFDAVHTVRRLRLSNCTNIKGSCLEPIRGSLVLEQIDLSLVGDNMGALPAPNISFRHVLPILSECCSLRHIQFPDIREIVLNGTESSSELKHFITKYNQMWKKRDNVSCSKCSTDINISGGNNTRWMNIFGIQFYTCAACTRFFCDECASEVVEDKPELGRVDMQMLAFCAHCQKWYCADCRRMERCQVGIECDQYLCSDCNYLKECSGCTFKMCGDCFNERKCDKNKAYCDFCE